MIYILIYILIYTFNNSSVYILILYAPISQNDQTPFADKLF